MTARRVGIVSFVVEGEEGRSILPRKNGFNGAIACDEEEEAEVPNHA